MKLLIIPIVILVLINACSEPDKNENTTASLEQLQMLIENQQPASINEEITTNQETILELQELKKNNKFGPETDDFEEYVGLLPESNQPLANEILNESIGRIIVLLQNNPKPEKNTVLEEFKIGLNNFNGIATDTEDREKVCKYYDSIRIIIGFESTNGILNNWLYGF